MWRRMTRRVGVTTATGRDVLAAGLLAAGLVTVTVAVLALVQARQPAPAPVRAAELAAALALTVAGCAPIAVRRRWPGPAAAGATVLVLACAGFGVVATGPAVGLVVCAYTLPTVRTGRRAALVLTALAAAHVAGGVLLTRAGADVRELPTFWGVPGQDLDAMIVATAASYGIPAGIGAAVRRRRRHTAALLARAERLEAEREARDRAAAAEERGRIARELHDIAAHDLSAIVVQAGAADRLVDGDPVAAKAVLSAIRGQGRETLAALRQVVGILRDDDGGGRAPQPGLARLGDLVGGARDAGMTVALDRHGTPRPLPAMADLAAYRVVQEALTNARRHAPGAPVAVRVGWGDGVELDVRSGPPAGPPVAEDAAAGGGHGLVGMRERVRRAGGTLSAGPEPDGGWRVRAWLPAGRVP